MRLALGLDPGSVRVGLAAADPTGALASPVAVLPRARTGELWQRVREEVERRGAGVIVVGLPRELDGSEGPAAADARTLAAAAERETGLPVELWDERFTTAQAERQLIGTGTRRDRRRRSVDGVAAALMLQGWLDAQRLHTGMREG
ncbi:MAG TPA: Holliday junction resolvase RuvX [Candidatus Dormibacteraeota bacterium]|nr:Holliday junction resolvase RuvX [Candidatus Dormibacteraeota bacterium]